MYTHTCTLTQRRGYCARRRDPEVMRVRLELSRIKLEAYVATLYSQLQGYEGTEDILTETVIVMILFIC